MKYTIENQLCKCICTDEASPIAWQHVSVRQHSDRHDASGKQEIQNIIFSSSSSSQIRATTSDIGSDEEASTIHKVELLYQRTPRRRNSFHRVPNRQSWTDSRETYQNAARREYYLLLANHRQANHLITVKYLQEFSASDIRATWKVLKVLLVQQGIIAFVVIEITTRPHVLPDGERWHYPINRIHYHCLVDSDLSARRLRDIFNRACLDACLEKDEFGIVYESIPDRKTFEHKCKYILKFDTFKEQAILFRPDTGINKVCSIGRWFIDADGRRVSKAKLWKSIVADWYSR